MTTTTANPERKVNDMQDPSGRAEKARGIAQGAQIEERIERAVDRGSRDPACSNPLYFAHMLAACFVSGEHARAKMIVLSEIAKGLERAAVRLERNR